MVSCFVIFINDLRRNKIQKLAAGSFDLPASGLWAQHASLRHPALMLLSADDFCTLNLRIVRPFLLLSKTDGLN